MDVLTSNDDRLRVRLMLPRADVCRASILTTMEKQPRSAGAEGEASGVMRDKDSRLTKISAAILSFANRGRAGRTAPAGRLRPPQPNSKSSIAVSS